MARTRSPLPEPRPEALTAAAVPLKELKYANADPSRLVEILLNGDANQVSALCWLYYATIPELRYVAQYVANGLSQARMFVAEVGADPYNPTALGPRHVANDLMATWAGGFDGQAELLAMLGLHMTVTGDSVVAGPDQIGGAPPFNQWRVYSGSQMVARTGGTIFLRNPDGTEGPLPANVKPFRVWRPHPRDWWSPDSPTRACFTVLRELDLLDKHVHATAISRLISAGLLLVPDDITFPATEVENEGVQVDPFIKMFSEIASIAIKNRESAAAVVPVTLRGPADALAQVRTVDFYTKFDEAVPALREVALRRLGLGMDIPPEVLLGMSQSNSWSAWQTDETTVRMHIQPLMQLIVGAITQGWLRPALEALPEGTLKPGEIDRLVVWFDLSNLKVHQNISGDAQAGYDRFEIDGTQLRLASGVAPDAEPNKKELAKQICFELIRTNPAQAAYAINALRDLGYVNLPEAYDITRLGPVSPVPDADGGPPGQQTTQPETTTKGGLPGKRSSDKQVNPPPPPATGDPSNNTPTPK